MSTSFAQIAALHAQLDELFALHQELVLCDALARAGDLLAAYRELLALHMAHEETLLLPLYERGEGQRWPAELFIGQHEKMNLLLDRAAGELAGAVTLAGRQRRRAVLSLLERETAFKHLSEHHHLAEDQALFPVCDAVAAEGERAAILTRIEQEFAAAHARHAPLIAEAHVLLG
jgi:iron-sulfur cluster repair protein YtfE (RIC family)